MSARRELTKATVARYRSAERQSKITILNEFCAASGYNRDYAATLLRTSNSKAKHKRKSKGARKKEKSKKIGRPALYDDEVVKALTVLWKRFDFLCGKRLVPLIRSLMPFLETYTTLNLSRATINDLARISPPTVDRLLAPARKQYTLSGRSYTRRETPLKDLIPVRTFDEWKACPPGHFQLDTVGHDGGRLSEECSFSLCATDVCTGWTERFAMQNRAFRWVHQGLQAFLLQVPFPILHLHPDGGSEFINMGLVAFCNNPDHPIQLSRSRPGKKNDNCYVEQKNFDMIRKLVGYMRYATPPVLDTLNTLYRVHGILRNYFYPSQKLLEKVRHGSKVIKHHDAPMCPADRLLAHPAVSSDIKQRIRATKASLDPLHLAAEVDRLFSVLQRQVKTVSSIGACEPPGA